MNKKTFIKIIIFTLSLIHLGLLISIIYTDSNKPINNEEKEVVKDKYLYDLKPLTINIKNNDLRLNVVEIEVGKLLVINDEISFSIEEVDEIYYSRYDDFLVLIEKYNDQTYRFIIVDSNLNILKDYRSYKRDDVYLIKDFNLFETRIVLFLEFNSKKLEIEIQWENGQLIEKITDK